MSDDSPVKRADMALPVSDMALPVPPGEASKAADESGLTPQGKRIWGLQHFLPARLLFNHVDRLVATGYVRRLEPTDLYPAEDLGMDAVRSLFEAPGAVIWRGVCAGRARFGDACPARAE
jgi:hypothetical protein